LSKEYTGQDRDDNNVQLWGLLGQVIVVNMF